MCYVDFMLIMLILHLPRAKVVPKALEKGACGFREALSDPPSVDPVRSLGHRTVWEAAARGFWCY